MQPLVDRNWQKARRKTDPEQTRAGLMARIQLLEHQKKQLLARIEELEIPALNQDYPHLDIDPTGQHVWREH